MELNKIILGDAYKLIKDIPDKSVDLVYTDIPYDISYTGGGCLNKNVANNIKIMNEHKENLIQGIDYSIFDECVRVLKHIYIYIWCSQTQILDIMKIFVDKYHCNYQILVWCKDNPVPFGNKQFLSDIEYCLVFYEPGVKVNLGCENKHKWYVSHINTADKNDYGHPTCKPIEYVKKHILNSTEPGDVVLDPFMGSGTTASAAKETGRNYIGFEINPEYHKIATDRLAGINQKGEMNLFDIKYEDMNLFEEEEK